MSTRQTAIVMALEAALLSAFTGDAALCALVRGRIHEGSPRGAVLPYLAFANVTCGDFSGGGTDGARVSLTLEAVAEGDDRRRALTILDAAVDRALGADLGLATGALVLLRAIDTRVERTRDGRAWRASAVLSALVDG